MHLILTGSVFNFPYHPGYKPVVPYWSTGEIKSKIVRQYKAKKTQFNITKACEDALKQQILSAFHNAYVEVVANTNDSFAHTTTL